MEEPSHHVEIAKKPSPISPNQELTTVLKQELMENVVINSSVCKLDECNGKRCNGNRFLIFRMKNSVLTHKLSNLARKGDFWVILGMKSLFYIFFFHFLVQ